MKRFVKISIGIIILTLLGFMVCKVIAKIKYKKEVATHISSIPQFAYKDINGEAFTNQNLKAVAPIIFMYFNSECDFCQHEAQMVKENLYKLEKVQIVFISYEPKEKINNFAQKYKLKDKPNITFLQDEKMDFNKTFDVTSLPCIVLYDENYKLIEKIKGQVKIEYILKKLEL